MWTGETLINVYPRKPTPTTTFVTCRVETSDHSVNTCGAKKHELLAHTIRASGADPVREAVLIPDTGEPVQFSKRRVGRPRDN